MDWHTLFEEKYGQPGASQAAIERLVTEVSRPLSAEEICEINAAQQNPFRKSDPLHAMWKSVDPAGWELPTRLLPASYISLLKWSNGGEFRAGERWFQFFSALDPGNGVRAMTLAYHVPEYMPGALPIAFDGSGTFYLLDMRRPAIDDEYPVVCAHAGSLGWAPTDHFQLAPTLPTAIGG